MLLTSARIIPISKATKPRARLNEDQAIQIFQSKLDLPQLSSTELATLYRVSEKTIRDIWTGRTWSRETWHLDTSRTLPLKHPGRPKGWCMDTQPRKKPSREIHHDESSKLIGPFTEACSEGSSSWYRSDSRLSYNTVERRCPSSQLQTSSSSIDAQLHDWDAFWISCPSADPFRSEWTPKPLEYD